MSITRGPVIAAVAALARRKELVLVVAELPDAGYGCTSQFVAQLRVALPRFTITEVMISVWVADDWVSRGRDSYALVDDLLNDGSIAVTPTSDTVAPGLAALLATRFGAEMLVLTADNAEEVANRVALCGGPGPWSSN